MSDPRSINGAALAAPIGRRSSAGKDALDRFAGERKLDPCNLRLWGVEARGERLSIPYHDTDGAELYRKIRNEPGAEMRFWYDPKGCKLKPYGLSRIGKSRKAGVVLYLCEGESDTWAMWSAGLPALGIPGANNARCLEREHLVGVETLYVCRDAGESGKAFVAGVQARLTATGYAGKAFVLEMPGDIKDICELWAHDPDGFRMTLTDMEADARELPCGKADSKAGPTDGQPDEKPRLTLELIDCDMIQARPTRWLVKDFIPLGSITLLAGDGGCGKSTITFDLAARVSRGEAAWGLDYEPGTPAGVLLAGCEDSPDSTIVPLLLAAGADLARVQLVNGVKGEQSSLPFTLGSFDALADTLEGRPDIRLVVIDPVSAFLPADVDDCQDASIRTLIRPLGELAARFNVAIVLVRHLNKSESSNAGNLVGGNRGWVNAARSAFLFGRDPGPEGQEDDRRHVMVQMKVNLSAGKRGLAYRVEQLTLGAQDDVLRTPNFVGLSAEDERAMREQLRRVRWLGETDQTDDDLARARRRGRAGQTESKAEECAAWLRTYLGEYSWPDKEVNAAREQAGFSFQAYRDAKAQLKAEGLEQRPRKGVGRPAPWWIGFGPESSRPDRPDPAEASEPEARAGTPDARAEPDAPATPE